MVIEIDRYAGRAGRNIAPLEAMISRAKILRPDEIEMVLKYVPDISIPLHILFNPKMHRSMRLKDGTVYEYKTVQGWLEKLADMRLRDMKLVGGTDRTVAYRYNGRWIRFAGQSIEFSRRFNEIFVTEPYKRLDCRNRDVVDIGANVGDTAIYFALKGARKVYGYEPYPYPYRLAVKNVALNKLGSHIRVFNEGCAGRSRMLRIDPKLDNRGRIPVTPFKNGFKVKMLALRGIVKRHRIEGGSLKIDCEGWEYDILLNSDTATLRKFQNMIIEYHYGYMDLIDKLKGAGFRISRTISSYVPKSMAEQNSRYCGLIYAERIDA